VRGALGYIKNSFIVPDRTDRQTIYQTFHLFPFELFALKREAKGERKKYGEKKRLEKETYGTIIVIT